MSSRYLSENGIKGLIKTGNVIIPGDDQFPKFSETDFFKQIKIIISIKSLRVNSATTKTKIKRFTVKLCFPEHA